MNIRPLRFPRKMENGISAPAIERKPIARGSSIYLSHDYEWLFQRDVSDRWMIIMQGYNPTLQTVLADADFNHARFIHLRDAVEALETLLLSAGERKDIRPLRFPRSENNDLLGYDDTDNRPVARATSVYLSRDCHWVFQKEQTGQWRIFAHTCSAANICNVTGIAQMYFPRLKDAVETLEKIVMQHQ